MLVYIFIAVKQENIAMNDKKFETIKWSKKQKNKRLTSLIKEYTEGDFDNFDREERIRKNRRAF